MIVETELLAELKAAHLIIRHALSLMAPDQKMRWAVLNERAGVSGDGVTRANEREAVIKKAEAQ